MSGMRSVFFDVDQVETARERERAKRDAKAAKAANVAAFEAEKAGVEYRVRVADQSIERLRASLDDLDETELTEAAVVRAEIAVAEEKRERLAGRIGLIDAEIKRVGK